MPGNAFYQIRVFNPYTGGAVGITTTWRSLFLERSINNFSTLQLSLDAMDPARDWFVLDAVIEVWRRLNRAGAQWYREDVLLHRSNQSEFTSDQLRIFTSYSRGLVDLLHRRNIEYKATTAFTLKSGPGETVMKQFVNENAGPGANNALRASTGFWNAPITGLQIEPDAARGSTWKGARAGNNLLDVLQEIAEPTSVDFDVVRTDAQGDGQPRFEFRCYYPQRGSDRTSEVTFSLKLSNMTDVLYNRSRTEEATAVVVAGQGEGESRRILRKLNTSAASESPWNVIETRRDGRAQPTFNELDSMADEALKELASEDNFRFAVLQTTARQYGAEYFLGDKVRFQYENIDGIAKITGISINVSEGHEEINLELGQLPRRLV